MAMIGGFESCQPSAFGRGAKSGPISKRVSGSLPHQPPKRGIDVSRAWRSCTKAPATAPGPELRYL